MVTYFACGIFGHGENEEQAREDWKSRVGSILEAVNKWKNLYQSYRNVNDIIYVENTLANLYNRYSDHRSEKEIACQSLQQMESSKEALKTSLDESGAQRVTFVDEPEETFPEGPQG